jgi:hypothetical protein
MEIDAIYNGKLEVIQDLNKEEYEKELANLNEWRDGFK